MPHALANTAVSVDLPDAFRNVFALARALTVSEWTDRYRVMPARYGGTGRGWGLVDVPHTREILDTFAAPDIDRITVKKSSRACGTEMLLSMIGYAADVDPGPALFVFNSDDAAKEEAVGRFKATFEESPQTRQHLPHQGWATADGLNMGPMMPLFFGWLTSQATMIRRTARHIFVDEIDNAPLNVGNLGDTVTLLRKRYDTFPVRRRQMVVASSPTFPSGPIQVLYDESDGRAWHWPCPACGVYTVPSFYQVKFPSDATPDEVEINQLAEYECPSCKERTREDQRLWMNRRGVWIPRGVTIVEALPLADADVVADASIEQGCTWTPPVNGERELSRHAGFHVWRIMTPWSSFDYLAAEFLRCKGSRNMLRVFANATCGESFDDVESTAKPMVVLARVDHDRPPGIVPVNVVGLTSGIDVQKESAYFVVVGWAAQNESFLIDHGHVLPHDETDNGIDAMVEAHRHVLSADYHRADGTRIPLVNTCIDSGYKPDDVNAYTAKRLRQADTWATKGMSKPHDWVYRKSVWTRDKIRRKRQQPDGVLIHVNTERAKDLIFDLLTGELETGPGSMRFHSETDDDVAEHLTAEHKVLRKGRSTWVKKSTGRPNHYLDAVAGALIAAAMVNLLFNPGDALPMQGARHRAVRRKTRSEKPWVQFAGQWIRN